MKTFTAMLAFAPFRTMCGLLLIALAVAGLWSYEPPAPSTEHIRSLVSSPAVDYFPAILLAAFFAGIWTLYKAARAASGNP